MFSNISLAGTGGIITLLEFVLKAFNIDIPGGQVGDAVNGLVTAYGVVALIWGQVRRPDLKGGLIRK